MSIWADTIMTTPSENGHDKSITRQNENSATSTISCKPAHQSQYGLDAIESFPSAVDFDATKTMPNNDGHQLQYSIGRTVFATPTKVGGQQATNTSVGGIRTGALSFIKNIGALFPRRSPRNHTEASVENCDVLESCNVSAEATQIPSGKLMPNRGPITTAAGCSSSSSSSSSSSCLSGNSSKQLCTGGGSAKEELMLSAKCDRDNNCDNSMALCSDNVGGGGSGGGSVGDNIVAVVADVRIVVPLPDKGTTTDTSSFILPRVNLKTSGNPVISSVSSSHYSTEKSGSSGYYSSNIYSTSSFDEHIYSEPANGSTVIGTGVDGQHITGTVVGSINVLHAPAITSSAVANTIGCLESTKLPLNVGKPVPQQQQQRPSPTLKLQQMRQLHHLQQQQQQQLGLNNLETSIKSLELHLKEFNGPAPLLDASGQDDCMVDGKYDKRKSVRLPTIMEGVDGGAAHNWQEDADDSLMDLDMDSFLLANEVVAKETTKKPIASVVESGSITGNVNPAFDDSRVSNKFIENNYKCHKYVNSCPDDAYNVEGISEDHQTIDKSLAFYLKKCEDQVHYQNTKDILEEIREKLNCLLSPVMTAPAPALTSNPFSSDPTLASATSPPSNAGLQQNILSLKGDLDNYLSLMNKNNEMGIKQFCTGLSKNYKLLTIQNALENREKLRCADSACSNYDGVGENKYEQIAIKSGHSSYREREESQFDTVYVRDGFSFGYKSKDPFHLDFSTTKTTTTTTATAATDTSLLRRADLDNFQLQAKLKRSPCSSCEEVMNSFSDVTTAGDTSDQSDEHVYGERLSQLQQNIALHQHRSGSSMGGSRHQQRDAGMALHVDDKDAMLDWHRNKPSIWELYYGSNRVNQTILKKVHSPHSIMSYPSSRPESDFTLDLPRAEQLRIKMKKEKQFRHRCRIVTSFLSLVFFLLTVMVVSLILTRGKRMFGSMI